MIFVIISLFGICVVLYFYAYLYNIFLTYHILISVFFLSVCVFLILRTFVLFDSVRKIFIISLIVVYSFWNFNIAFNNYININLFLFFLLKFNLYSDFILTTCVDLL